ncbi:MAG: acetoacetate--CoA ligase [candidate division Zixibacteria bacterium]|nr:acetoacetate--CoA ligase [candidate division Zixibacteria bacterium]
MSSPLWKPSPDQISGSNLTRFSRSLSASKNRNFDSYAELHKWSVTDIEDFWAEIFCASEIIHSKTYDTILSDRKMSGAKWFSGAKLNFAENLLRYRDDRTAIIHWRENAEPLRISFSELYSEVASCAQGLRELGVTKGDRVAAYLPNIPETVIAMLATTSLGALWSSCSPDFGLDGALARFKQIEPKILFAAESYCYNSKTFDLRERIKDLSAGLESLTNVIVVTEKPEPNVSELTGGLSWDLLQKTQADKIRFEQLPFDQPVYIMYSSGTTGAPKCIVHGAGGTLLQHWKEHSLHTDLGRDDILFYFTTCGWMMWNWLVSALQIGATIFLYDGSPGYPDLNVLWRAIEVEGITVFGTSPKYLSTCQKNNIEPGADFDLTSLKTILSTGSPLSAENFRWIYNHVKKDVRVSSISGGTDIISCFMLGNPNLPVFSEEIQCPGLGMKVETFDENGNRIPGQIGELVCTEPFPSMPVSFWNDPDGEKYSEAYFETYPGVWRHGDFIKQTENGGVIVYGRSDATLNPGGVRIGTAEIYGPVEALDEVIESIVVGRQEEDDVHVILFVILNKGATLDDELTRKIKNSILKSATPRHVPSKIFQVSDIPRTISGKKVEIAVRQILNGQDVTTRDALANPESLNQFTDILDALAS